MDSFDQLIELTNEVQDRCEEFIKSKSEKTIEQAFADCCKSKEICDVIQKRLDAVNMREDGSGYGYDRCVYYMAKNVLNMYEYSTLAIFTSKLTRRVLSLEKQLAEEKQIHMLTKRKKSRKSSILKN